MKVTLFNELKRRNVIKVASVYLVTCWLILQIVAVISPALLIPAIFSTIVTVILIIGFPLVCIFAWAFELTPDGLKFTGDVSQSESITHHTGSLMNKALVAALLLALSFIAFDKLYWETEAVTTDYSIAVLPFQDMSHDSSQEYFGDGIAEEILNALSRLNQLTVISRTSSFRYKSEKNDIRTIGNELGVNYVLEGSVRKDKQNLRITAQLIEVESGAHIWSQTYDRKLTGIFEVQDELTFAITEALKLNLLKTEVASTPGMTENPEAYEYFVQGRELMYKRTTSSIKQAVQLLKSAIQVDPQFHLAKAMLANAYTMAAEYGGIDATIVDEETSRLFWELQLAPDFPLKWLVFSNKAGREFNDGAAYTLLEKAFLAAPHDPLIQNVFLLQVKDIDHTIAAREQILKTNPASQINYYNLSSLYWVTGQNEKALAIEQRMQREFGNTLISLKVKLERVYGQEHDLRETLALIDAYEGKKDLILKGVETATLLYLGDNANAIAKLTANLTENPSEFLRFSHIYRSLLWLQQNQQLTESEETALLQVPVSEKQRIDSLLSLSLLQGAVNEFEEFYDIHGDTSYESFASKLDVHGYEALLYMAIQKQRGNSQMLDKYRADEEKILPICTSNFVNAVGEWCVGLHYILDTPEDEYLVPLPNAVEYWSMYDIGSEALMLTSPLYNLARANTAGAEALTQMLESSIGQHAPELIVRKDSGYRLHDNN